MLRTLENRLIYRPDRYPLGDWEPSGLAFEDVAFRASDGCRLHGWYCACPLDVQSRYAGPRPVVLYCHGNAGNISHRAAGVALWQQMLGVDVFLFDYRGYGRSDGRPDESGLYLDSRAAYQFLTNDAGVDPHRLVLRGGSLGGAVALELALTSSHRCVILESTFTSLSDVASQIYPAWLIRLLLRTEFPSRDRIARCSTPILITHGTADRVVPYQHGVELSRSNSGAQLVSIEGADHHNVIEIGGESYFRAIADFLTSCFDA